MCNCTECKIPAYALMLQAISKYITPSVRTETSEEELWELPSMYDVHYLFFFGAPEAVRYDAQLKTKGLADVRIVIRKAKAYVIDPKMDRQILTGWTQNTSN